MKRNLSSRVGTLALIFASGLLFLWCTKAPSQSEARKESAAAAPSATAPRPTSEQETPAQSAVPQKTVSLLPAGQQPAPISPLAEPKFDLKLAPGTLPAEIATGPSPAPAPAVKAAVLRPEARVVTVAGRIEQVVVTPPGARQRVAVAIMNPSSGEVVLLVRDAAYPEAFRKAAQMAGGNAWSEIQGIRVRARGLPAVRVQDVRSTT